MSVKRPQPELDPTRLLDAVVVPNRALVREERAGVVILWLPLQERFWMRAPWSWFLPIRKRRGFELDALGQEVFAECDGERRLEEIIERFAKRHGLRFHEARQCVVQFMASLFDRKLVALRVPNDALAETPARKGAPREADRGA